VQGRFSAPKDAEELVLPGESARVAVARKAAEEEGGGHGLE